MSDPGPLIGEGRDTQIFDLGGGRVLRRPRNRRSLAREAAVMEHVRAAGFAAPRVFEVRDDGSLVMERIDGPSMLARLIRAPWKLRAYAHTLADLHGQLHRIPTPGGVDAIDGADTMAHLDLHPDNVILSEAGPVLIDWANARPAPPGLDVAMTWVLLATGEVPSNRAAAWLADTLRSRYLDAFLDAAGRDAALPYVRRAADRRLADRNTRPAEREAVDALVARLGV